MIQRAIRWYDYITINIYWFALTTRAQVLTPLILPLLVQQFVGDTAKGTYLGNIRLLALMVALLFQSMMGLISDRSTLPLGRRRPFIIIGTIGEIIVFVLIGFIAGMEGMTGYWFLFALYTLSMLSSNTAHAATQALIPDLVPEDKRGSFSGVKALLELPVPLIFVSFVVGKMVSAGNIWGAILSVIAVMIVCAAITMFVPEKRLTKSPTPMDWKPILRLLLMTAVFTLIILGTGKLVNWVMNLSDGLQGSASMIVTGLVGLAGMAVAIGLGVWSSVQISVGNEAKTNPSFTWWVTNRLAFLAGSTNLASFMIYFLQERFVDLQGEKAAGPASTIIMFVGVFILLTALPSGWLSDRFGKKTIIAVAALLAASGTAIIILIPTMPAVYIGACFIGAGTGFFYSANWALGTEIVPKDEAGRYLGISNLAGAGAGAVGAYIGGPIGDHLGYTLLMAIYGVLFLLSIFALRKIQEPRFKLQNP